MLCDGTFIHHLVANHITPHDKAISNTLGGSVKLFTTRCVIGELNSLGASHAESLKDANHHFNIARCEHEKRINAASCIVDIIGENNSEHFFVATQDANMRKKFQEIPGVPVMFGLRNAVFLEKPSSSQREFVNSTEEERKHVSEKEFDLLKKTAKQIHVSESNGDEAIAEEIAAIKKKISKDGKDLKDKAQFKRKRAKGPNPLSRKKKKNPVSPGPNLQKGDKASEQTSNGKSRKRKRSRKSKNVAVASS